MNLFYVAKYDLYFFKLYDLQHDQIFTRNPIDVDQQTCECLNQLQAYVVSESYTKKKKFQILRKITKIIEMGNSLKKMFSFCSQKLIYDATSRYLFFYSWILKEE